MVHVDYFLCCVKLETGGKIIALFHVITYLIAPFLLIPAAIVGILDNVWDRKKVLNDAVALSAYTPSVSTIILTAFISLVIAIICIAVIVIAYRSMNAINTRNHTLMFEMMALTFAITCFFCYTFFIQLWLWPIQSIPTLVTVAIYFYLFIVIYSLYRAFRKEYEREIIRQEKANA